MPTNKVNNNIKLESGGGLVNSAVDGLSVDLDLTGLNNYSQNTISLITEVDVLAKKVVSVMTETTGTSSVSPTGQTSTSDDTTPSGGRFSNSFISPNIPSAPFLLKLTTFNLPLLPSGGTLTGTMYSELYLAGANHKPTGSVLSTSNTVSVGSPTVTFNADLLNNTEYCVVSYVSVSTNNLRISVYQPVGGSGQYTFLWNGSSFDTYSGVFGITSTTSFSFLLTKAGFIEYASSASNDQFANNIVGFTTEAKTANNAVKIQISGVVSGLSGLTIGSTYYLSTAGGISTSAGSASRKLGIAISATELLLIRDNV